MQTFAVLKRYLTKLFTMKRLQCRWWWRCHKPRPTRRRNGTSSNFIKLIDPASRTDCENLMSLGLCINVIQEVLIFFLTHNRFHKVYRFQSKCSLEPSKERVSTRTNDETSQGFDHQQTQGPVDLKNGHHEEGLMHFGISKVVQETRKTYVSICVMCTV